MKRWFFVIIVVFYTSSLTMAQHFKTDEKPQLVVNVLVEGLQFEHISRLWNYFGEGGFKRLINEGTFFPNTQFNYISGGSTTDCASLMTGTLPAHHGILGDFFFEQKTREVIPITFDGKSVGIGSQENHSPVNLFASTFTDVLKVSTNAQSKVFSIALNASNAVLLGGHTADCAIWLDTESGKLATSSFYEKGLPSWCDKMNTDFSLDNMTDFIWQPLYAPFTYNYPSANDISSKNFLYKAEKYKTIAEKITAFKSTPFANKLVRKLAIETISKEKLGKTIITDVLSLQFTVNPHIPNAQELLSSEKEDIYLRLDKEIKLLLDSVDLLIGKENALVILSANQSGNMSMETMKKHRINCGRFNASRAMALLNNYLMLLNGQGNWVEGYFSKNIYLNRRLAEKKSLDFKQIQYQAEQFMMDFQGIQSVYTTENLAYTNGSDYDLTQKIKNSINFRRSGTIVFTLLPGWVEVDGKENIVGPSERTHHQTFVAFYGFGIKPQENLQTIQFVDIAPTLCNLLSIPPPNACVGRIIPLNK
jgi:hypothetical protein